MANRMDGILRETVRSTDGALTGRITYPTCKIAEALEGRLPNRLASHDGQRSPDRWQLNHLNIDIIGYTTKGSTTTAATPTRFISSASAARGERSRMRPRVYGPRSLILTTIERPLSMFVTFA